MRKPSEKMDTFAQLWDAVLSLYMPGNCVRALACGNNFTSFPKVIGDVKGCILVKLSRHPEMKIAFPVPLSMIYHYLTLPQP